MARMTQDVGLNNYAEKYVKHLQEKYTCDKSIYHMADGMFGEEVFGAILKYIDEYGNKITLKEVVQDSPWSSGLMIFTHLEMTVEKSSGQVLSDFHNLFSWMVDPSLEDLELDYETGRYYV